MKKTALTLLTVALLASCVSKKKYVALENQNGELKSQLQKTQVENEELEGKFAAIQERVDEYNNKISSLTDENNSKLVTVGDAAVISEDTKGELSRPLVYVDAALVRQATSLKDSMNLAITYNLQQSMSNTDLNEDEDIAINIDETVVMISISDKLLFNTASYRISNKA